MNNINNGECVRRIVQQYFFSIRLRNNELNYTLTLKQSDSIDETRN